MPVKSHFNILILGLLIISFHSSFGDSPKPQLIRRFNSCTQNLLQKTHSNREVFQRRSLKGYERMLGKSLLRESLFKISSNDTWIDMGAGRAKAMIGYYLELKSKSKLRNLPYMIAISLSGKGKIISAIEDNNLIKLRKLSKKLPKLKPIISNIDSLRKSGKFTYIQAEVASGSLLKMRLPKAKLITDVWGPLAYTNEVDRVLNEYLKLLKINGEILIHMHWKKFPNIKIGNQYFDFLTWIASTTEGLRIEEITDSPLAGTFKITKLKANVEIPHLNLVTDGING